MAPGTAIRKGASPDSRCRRRDPSEEDVRLPRGRTANRYLGVRSIRIFHELRQDADLALIITTHLRRGAGRSAPTAARYATACADATQ